MKWMILERTGYFFFEGITILCSNSVSMEIFVGGWYMGKNGSNFHGQFQEVSLLENPMVDR